ncbi:tetratricopeptide repeat protein 6 [Pelodytes ibericus]
MTEEISDRRGHLHFRLNYAEELRIKKDLERLLKRPQKDFRHATLEARPGSGSASHQLHSLSSPPAKAAHNPLGPLFHSPGPVNDTLTNLLARPVSQSARTLSKNATEETKGHGAPQNDHSYIRPQAGNLKKTAISSIVGTTKCISVFKRPEPPSKPRSYMPKMPPKPRASEKLKKEREIPKLTSLATPKIKKTGGVRSHSTSSIDSDASSSSSDSDSADNDDSKSRRKPSKRHKKCSAKKGRDVALSENKRECMGTDQGTSRALMSQISVPPVLPVDGQSQRTVEKIEIKPIPLISPVKAAARSVDEIIASLRSPNVYTASDLMIKQLMESVLGLQYEVSFGEDVKERPEEKQPPPTDVLPPDQIPDIAGAPSNNSILGEPFPLSTEKHHEKPSALVTPTQEGTKIETEQEEKSPLKSPIQISVSDVVGVKGDAAPLRRREDGKIHRPPTLLATWEPRAKEQGQKTIHHFCTVSPSHILPSDLQMASRVHHTVDKKGHHVCTPYPDIPIMHLSTEAKPNGGKLQEEAQGKIRIGESGLAIPLFQPGNQRAGVVTLPPHTAQSLEDWQKIAEYYMEGRRMQLVGEKISFHSKNLKMFWTPAPPKFSAPVSHVQNILFEKYESCMEEQERIEGMSSLQQESDSSDDEKWDPERLEILEKLLSRRYNSFPDLRPPCIEQSDPPLTTLLSASTPNLSGQKDAKFHLSADFQTSMKELEMLKQLSNKRAATSAVNPKVEPEPSDGQDAIQLCDQPETNVRTSSSHEIQLYPSYSVAPQKPQLKHVPHKKKKAKKRKSGLDPVKMQMVVDQLKQSPRKLERSASLVRLPISSVTRLHARSASLPRQLAFSTFITAHGGVNPDKDTREWVRDIWNKWFDEVFPPSLASVEDEEEYFDVADKDAKEKRETGEISMTISLDSVPPLLIEDPTATTQEVENEIVRLTSLIDEQKTPSGFHYCRRGALNRKLGNLSLALEDLNWVTNQEPQLLDAYWHRHLIYLVQGKNSEALDDLNTIIKSNKTCADVYLSKAEIFKQKRDFTMAILSYSQAIKCRPTDDDIYFRRAQMYEAQDDIIIAMDDYAKCFHHNPSRTDALMKRAWHYFRSGSWMAAVQDFSNLIKQDFTNAKARTYRGRAYSKLGHYSEAAEDFSAAIHLDPGSWLAFYYRGCLLRKCCPQQAVQDFSISVLLNDDPENLKTFLHRGILYVELGLWTEAVFDFEWVLTLDSSVALAHINLGLIALQHRNQYTQAIRHFTAALRGNPVYVRAYLCRAQAYQKNNDLRSALRDITRAIHLQPDSPQYYIIRGQYLYEMKRYDLASFCIHHAAEMTEGSAPVQQALVQSFRHDYNSAIGCLVSAIKARPTLTLTVLLGKTQMKAKKNKDAAESFRQALGLFDALDQHVPATSEKAEIYYLLGLSYMEQFQFLQALSALTSAIKSRSDYCDAYYQRGLCHMRLRQAKCVQDFNRALETNPKHFQAYLCRAAFYGYRKRYSKAIMNCNAAIKVQPRSVRAYLYRGALKYHIKAYKLAIQDLTKAADLNPSCSLVYYNRGVCYHQTKVFDEALKDYGIVLLLGGWKETHVKVLVNRGLLYLELRDYSNALEDFKAVAVKTPEDAKIHQVIGNCYHRLKQYEQAVDTFNQVLKLIPLSPEGYIGRGNAYMEYGHLKATKQALRDFIKALHLNPKCLAARICLGYTLQALGLCQRAWNQFTVALDLDGRNVLGFEGRSIVNLQMGDTFAALQDINAAIKLGVTAQLLTNRGVIHQFMGKLPNAMKDYQAALSADSSYALAFFNAANLYLHNRQFSQAKEYYSQAIQMDPGNESAYLNRGITHMLLRDIAGALQDFQTVINLCPFSASVYFNRASLHNMLQLYQQAESDITQALLLQPQDPLMYKLRADIRGKMGLQKEAIEDYQNAIGLLQKSC